jgi:Ca2+-binding RTX toxin-like protein
VLTSQFGLVCNVNEVLASGSIVMVMSGLTREALAANFLNNPNGHTFTANGAGQIVSTQGGNGVSATPAYVSASTTGETIDVNVRGVANSFGSSGNDALTGDANANWLGGGQGSDIMLAGAGDDELLIDAQDLQDNIDGWEGFDIAQAVGTQGVTFNLAQAHFEVAIGEQGDDAIRGHRGRDGCSTIEINNI